MCVKDKYVFWTALVLGIAGIYVLNNRKKYDYECTIEIEIQVDEGGEENENQE